MIPEEKLAELRLALSESARPLIFFDDDPDGMCSFLQFYKFNPEAKGIIYKVAGPLDKKFLNKIQEYGPDAIFILDIAVVDQELLDEVKNVYWLDHHAPLKLRNVKYYNPMIWDEKDNRPVSYWAYQVTKSCVWLAMAGCIGDWNLLPDLRIEFEKGYSDLLPAEIKKPEEALFASPIGKLSRMMSFLLTGQSKDSMNFVKMLSRVSDPRDILEQRAKESKPIWKKYKKVNDIYLALKKTVDASDKKLILYRYSENKASLTSDLSNELLYENPEKFVIIAREGKEEMKCSLRSAKYEVLPILNKALIGVSGFGGGHVHACGCNVRKEDFDQFIENVRAQL